MLISNICIIIEARTEIFPFGPACRKSLAEFAPAGANRVQNIFAGGVYVGKNTSRLANVRA